MRIAVLSDIHANLIALEAVLAEVDALGPDAVWCLGDTVGYGPEPQACAELIAVVADQCLAGNHDLAVTGQLSLHEFNSVATEAAIWQREHIRPEIVEWLSELPGRQEAEEVTLAHGSPRDPVWEYITVEEIAGANSDHFQTQLCLVGHSHQAVGWRFREGGWWGWGRVQKTQMPTGEALSLGDEDRWILNPGSVGQPRDGDPRASFALLDLEANTWTWHRLEYDIDAVAHAIDAAGLPEFLGRRLYLGR